MKRKVLYQCIVCISILMAGRYAVSHEKQWGGKEWHGFHGPMDGAFMVGFLYQEVDLTQEQLDQIIDIHADMLKKIIPLHKTVMEKMHHLDELVESGNVSPDMGNEVIQEMIDAKRELMKAHIETMLKTKGILTEEQINKLNARMEMIREKKEAMEKLKKPYEKKGMMKELFEEELGLSKDQIQKLKEIQRSYHEKKMALQEKIAEKYKALMNEVKNARTYHDTITARINEIMDLKKEKMMLTIEHKSSKINILTPKQRMKLNEIKRETLLKKGGVGKEFVPAHNCCLCFPPEEENQ